MEATHQMTKMLQTKQLEAPIKAKRKLRPIEAEPSSHYPQREGSYALRNANLRVNINEHCSQNVSKSNAAFLPARFVTVGLAATITGLTEASIRNRIDRGNWQEGRQYVKREGRVFIDLRGYEKWAESGG